MRTPELFDGKSPGSRPEDGPVAYARSVGLEGCLEVKAID